MRRVGWIGIAVIVWSTLSASGWAQSPGDRAEILKTREAVWRAWFANDRKVLKDLVPGDTIAISSGEDEWKHQAEIFQGAADFRAKGGKLIRLEFPKTEIQRFGHVAVIYTQYLLETEESGKRSQTSGRATEIFVRRNGKWTNPGWHTDAGK